MRSPLTDGLIVEMPRIPREQLLDLIPSQWRAPSSHYAVLDYADLPTILVSLDIIEPPMRDPGIHDFDLPRLRSLASGIVNGGHVYPIEIGTPARGVGYQYRVRNGFHRFYLCKELGFTMMPTVLIDE
jgi:hypothetical protein